MQGYNVYCMLYTSDLPARILEFIHEDDRFVVVGTTEPLGLVSTYLQG